MRSLSYLSCMRCDADLTKEGTTRKRCSGCHSVFYDDVTCQKKDWPIHKTECKELQRRFITTVRPECPEVNTIPKLLARPDLCEIIAQGFYHGGSNVELGGGGPRFEKNRGLSLFWMTQWAKGGDPMALMVLAQLYQKGDDGVPQDNSNGFKLLKRAANQGSPSAQCQVGRCYFAGLGVRLDEAEGAKWFRVAAEQGHAVGQHQLGRCVGFGLGVERDIEEGIVWLRKAVEQGELMAQVDLGSALMDRTRSQSSTDASAMEAVKWYRRSAERGDAMGECLLGGCLKNGFGVGKDLTEAAFWLRKSADQGNSKAQCELSAYLTEYGGEGDADEAVRLLRLSAHQGYRPAIEVLRIAEDDES